LKIATYNVNGVNGRLPVLLRWLTETEPDIVCLQELKSPQERFPERDLKKAGYHAIWHGQKAWNGLALLARGANPVEVRRGLPGNVDDLHRPAITRRSGLSLEISRSHIEQSREQRETDDLHMDIEP
jgi:exodeoxyribonuclease-3